MVSPSAQQHLYLDDRAPLDVDSDVLSAGADGDGSPWIALSDNVFHPQGGGQPDDLGTVNGTPVRPRRHDGLVVLVPVEGPWKAPRPGEVVHAGVDAATRHRHSALHTAGHLLDALLREEGCSFVASNHFPGQSRVEARPTGPVDPAALRERLSARIAEAVRADLAVTSHWEGDTRFVTIDGLHTDPCGGTHLPSLGALGALTIRSVKTKSGRLKCGYDAEPR